MFVESLVKYKTLAELGSLENCLTGSTWLRALRLTCLQLFSKLRFEYFGILKFTLPVITCFQAADLHIKGKTLGIELHDAHYCGLLEVLSEALNLLWVTQIKATRKESADSKLALTRTDCP
jgi:hypothetical protein